MKELVVLGSAELAEERARGAELDRKACSSWMGRLAYRRDDGPGRTRYSRCGWHPSAPPARARPVGVGLLLLEPVLFAAVGASPGRLARGCRARAQRVVPAPARQDPRAGRAALFVVVGDAATPSRRSRRALAPRCCAPPCPPTPSGASSPRSPTPAPQATSASPSLLQTDRPRGAGCRGQGTLLVLR